MSREERLIDAAVGDDDDYDEDETEGLTRRGRGKGTVGASEMEKKIESARRFLWDDDEDEEMQQQQDVALSTKPTTVRGFSARYSDDPTRQQTTNIGAAATAARAGGFMAEGMESMEFRLHDADINVDGDEYLEGGKRNHRMNPIVSIFVGCYQVILGMLSLVFDKCCSPGCRKLFIFLILVGLIGGGVVKIASSVSMPRVGLGGHDSGAKGGRHSSKSHETERFVAVRQAILDSGAADPRALDKASTPQHNALHWLANIDKSEIEVDHMGFMSRYVLAVLYFSTEGKDSKDGTPVEFFTNWMSDIGVCVWHGVKCSIGSADENQHGDVERLELAKLMHKGGGTIPSELHELTSLEKLDLRGNKLEGTIPSVLFDNVSLKTVLMENNKLHGKLPNIVSQPCMLQTLNVANSKYGFGVANAVARCSTPFCEMVTNPKCSFWLITQQFLFFLFITYFYYRRTHWTPSSGIRLLHKS